MFDYFSNVLYIFYMICTGKELVERIDEELKKLKLSRNDLCKDVGIVPSSLVNWSNRNTIPAADIAYNIAEKLNVSVEYLLTGYDKNPYKKIIDEYIIQKKNIKNTLLDIVKILN